MLTGSGIPVTPATGAAFAASFAGVVFIMMSRNVRAKRVVLPLTLLVFSALWLTLFRQGALGQRVSPLVVGAALLANAGWVFRAIRYCDACGRTVQGSPLAPAGEPVRCPTCRAA